MAGNKHAARLFEDLLGDYNKLVRPVDINSETLVVKFKLKLSQLLDVVSFTLILVLFAKDTSCSSVFLQSKVCHLLFLSLQFQHEKNQIMTTNVWLQHVSFLFSSIWPEGN